MKIIFEEKNACLLRFDKDEDVIKNLADFIAEKNITAGSIQAIGSAKEVILAYYNLQEKKFEDHTIQEDIEIISFLGNITWMNNQPVVHAHGIFSKKDLSTIAGHVKKMVISATCEVSLIKFESSPQRSFDNETGLNILQ